MVRQKLRVLSGIAVVVAIGLILLDNTVALAAPPKPNGLSQIIATFGQPCNAQANDHSTSWPHGAWNGSGGASTMLMHPLLGNEVNVALYIVANGQGSFEKLTYGIGGYNCRKKTGSTTQYSTHAWGIAVDTNTVYNPQPSTSWNGTGWNGVNYGNALPNVWISMNFTWGLAWNDPHHFQYCTGY